MPAIPAALTVGIASSPDDRRQLARLLGASSAVLIVSNAEQAREILGAVELLSPAPPPAPPAPRPAADIAPALPELAVDSDRRVLRWRGQEADLTRLEHDVLVCLAEEPGQVWTYERLHHTVWGNKHLGRGSDMHSVVRRVRAKLALLKAPATIDAVRGVGFRLAPA
ncbi:winged helix-turn-helix domain-containing protein [Catellatospora sp. NPDC049609]|uniref:winged helix-turn-helix domain-containing protein n=1 Tax=Catellatospora sp. NPDC049609 TaxID=3155505 RepID=UPI003430067F